MSYLSSSLRALNKAQPVQGIHKSQFTPSLRIRALGSSVTSKRHNSSTGYGDKVGDPVSDNPQDQGPRPRADTEHPGPEPVSEGQGKSGIKEKAQKDPKGTPGERGPEAVTVGEPDIGGGVAPRSGTSLAGSKISDKVHSNQNLGKEEDVRKHNEEMGRRYGHRKEGEQDEKVETTFWSGLGVKDIGS